MRHLTIALLVLAALGWSARAQEEPETSPGKLEIKHETQTRAPDYAREAWIAIDRPEFKGNLFAALNSALDDTTGIGCLRLSLNDGQLKLLESDERDMLEVYAVKALHAEGEVWDAIVASVAKRPPMRKHIRFVYVGLMATCRAALLAARNKNLGPDNVLIIDPPVGDLPEIAEGVRSVGVDVLLHPRSDAEFTRDEAEIRRRLGPWGKSARVMRGPDPFASLESRVKYAAEQLRGYIVQTGKDSPFELPHFLRDYVADARVLNIGELHGNPGAHRLQLEVLREMAKQGVPLALSTEQFERDVQVKLDAYLKGEITEEQFLKDSRPWPNYADYRPLIELCKEKKIPVIAGNIPRRLASRVHKEGVDVIEKFTDEEKGWTAGKLNATPGPYRDKFMKAMGGADGHNAKLDTMYAAQCIKDDTMAESIATWLKANPKGRVLHINGAFHSENGLGVPEKLKALMPELKQAMLTCYEADKEPGKAVENEWYVRVPASRP